MRETNVHYRFGIEHFTDEGDSLGESPVTPDFGPAREWAYLDAVRRGAPLRTEPADGVVEPIWSNELGPPCLDGIRVLESKFPTTYFSDLADRKAIEHVAQGKLAPGDVRRYRMQAHPVNTPGSGDPDCALDPSIAPLDFGVEVVSDPIALDERKLDEFIVNSTAIGATDVLDVPIFVPESVLCEIDELSDNAGELETGGILVGRLHRDAGAHEIFAEVVAQIPARHAEANGASFAFTPETWAAADAAIALRGERELMLGWWHFHPNFCRHCPEQRQRSCAFARPFFSAEDVHLHRTCFSKAWQLALLVSDLPERGRTAALFGWRKGKVVERGFRTLEPAKSEKN